MPHQYHANQKKSEKNEDGASLFRMIILFALTFFVLHWGYQASRGTALEHVIIDIATVQSSVFVINQLNPAEQVQAQGHRLVSPQAKLSVLNGCEGTESLFLIIAAIMAFKTSWRHKLLGLFTGTLLIYILNQTRIVALYFILQIDRSWFAALHGYIGPTLIIAISGLFYLWWLQWPSKNLTNKILHLTNG